MAVAETVVAGASATSVAGHFGPATREAKREHSPTPATTSSVPDRREVVGVVVEEFGTAAAAAADDQPAVAGSGAGSGSCHKVPADKTVTAVNTQFRLNHTCAHIIIIVPNGSNSNSISIGSINNNSSNIIRSSGSCSSSSSKLSSKTTVMNSSNCMVHIIVNTKQRDHVLVKTNNSNSDDDNNNEGWLSQACIYVY